MSESPESTDQSPPGTEYVLDLDIAGTLRQARRYADLSQRELAARAAVAPSVVSRIEAHRTRPRTDLFARLLGVAGVGLVPCYPDGSALVAMPSYAIRDAAGRHFPAHLDVRQVGTRGGGAWWYIGGDFARYPVPLATFRRDRRIRDNYRRVFGHAPHYIDDRLELARLYRGARSRQPRHDFMSDGW
jgi:transcriptional regulator with XRE-family HTH domain